MNTINPIIFVTGNELKFQVAVRALQNSGIVLERKALNTPEIQSSRVEEVAEWSAVWASERLQQPVVVTDCGYSIEALHGFPGPFIKFVNQWFSADDFLNLLQGKSDRRIVIRDCLAYCRPGEKPAIFCQEYHGEFATQPGSQNGTAIDRVVILEGLSQPISDIPPDEMVAYWSRATVWQKLKLYLGGA